MSARLCTLSTVALLACLVAPALGQDASRPSPSAPPANLTFVEGAVDLIHDGTVDRGAASTMLLEGDLVRARDGRAEIVFADGTLLHLDRDSELELLSPTRLRLRLGRVMIRVSAAATGQYAIDTPAASVRLGPSGEYGVTADGRLDVTVARGIAEIDDGASLIAVRGGELASISAAGVRAIVQPFNSARWDAFERWAADRAYAASTAISAQQLPYELQPYGQVLDSYGRWDYVAPYGQVWFPAVAAGWRPYYTGAWSRTRYGLTWVGHDPWSWPTHHFGRWGYTGAAWYWIPARVWGPAWVSWSFVPGYVSWCPLGWNGRAVIGFSSVSTWIRGTSARRDHRDYWPSYDPWRAWTVMPRDQFDGRRAVRTYAVDPERLPEETRRVMAGYAVPRDSVAGPTPDAVTQVPAGSFDVAVPRGSVEQRRGIVRSPNAAPASTDVPSTRAARSPRSTHAPEAPVAPAVPVAPEAPVAPAISDAPRVYRPPVYAVPRSESPRAESPRGESPRAESPRTRRQDQGDASAPPPASSAPQRADAPSGRVRSPNAAPREPDGGRATPPPRQNGSEGQGQGGAVRRRPS